jgi:hypothetical protein
MTKDCLARFSAAWGGMHPIHILISNMSLTQADFECIIHVTNKQLAEIADFSIASDAEFWKEICAGSNSNITPTSVTSAFKHLDETIIRAQCEKMSAGKPFPVDNVSLGIYLYRLAIAYLQS